MVIVVYVYCWVNPPLTFPRCRQGGKTGAVQKCTACRGRGMRIMIRQLAPGMVQQMQSVCTDCNGEGKGHRDQNNDQVFVLCVIVTSSAQIPHMFWSFQTHPR